MCSICGLSQGWGAPLQGEVLGTLRHGEGRHTCSSGDSHVGAWQYDKRHGRGTAAFASGLRYEGQWREDQAHGWGATNNPPVWLFQARMWDVRRQSGINTHCCISSSPPSLVPASFRPRDSFGAIQHRERRHVVA